MSQQLKCDTFVLDEIGPSMASTSRPPSKIPRRAVSPVINSTITVPLSKPLSANNNSPTRYVDFDAGAIVLSGGRSYLQKGKGLRSNQATSGPPHITIGDITIPPTKSKHSVMENFIGEVYGGSGAPDELPLVANFVWLDDRMAVQCTFELREDHDATRHRSVKGKSVSRAGLPRSSVPDLSTEIYKFLVLLCGPRGAVALGRISSAGIRGLEVTSSDKRHRQLHTTWLKYSIHDDWFVEETNINALIKELELHRMNKEAIVMADNYPQLAEMIEKAEAEMEVWVTKLANAKRMLTGSDTAGASGRLSKATSNLQNQDDIRKIIELAIFLLASCKRLEGLALSYLGSRGKSLAKLLKKLNPSNIVDNCLETIFEGFAVLGKLNGSDNTILKLGIDKGAIEIEGLLKRFEERNRSARIQSRSFSKNARSLETIEIASEQITAAIAHSAAIIKADKDILETANRILPGRKGMVGSSISIFGGVTALGAACYVAEGIAAVSMGGIVIPAVVAATGVSGYIASSVCRSKRLHLKDLLEEEKKVYDTLLNAFISLIQHARLYEDIYFDAEKGYQYKTWIDLEDDIPFVDEHELAEELSAREEDLKQTLFFLQQASDMEEQRMKKQGKRV